MLGPQVGLEGARVDASGPGGGGEVLVGGDESGEGSVPLAGSTYVSVHSTVAADALDDGDGGKVVVFAEGFANVLGGLSARGGPDGGDGGFVETSGLETFVIATTPDVTAPNGDGGEWLIDPNDIEIVPGGGAANIDSGNPFVSTDDSARIGIDLIIAALSGGQTVTVQTTESGFDSQGGSIDVNAPLDIEATSGTNTLILDAHGVINVNRPISDAVGGAELNLVLDAGDVDVFNTHGIHFNADVTIRSGSLTTDADYVHVQNGATLTLDRIHWQENSRHVAISSGDGDTGTLVVRNLARVDATSYINVGQEGGVGTLTIMGGSDVAVARGVGIGDSVASSEGTVTVAGEGSTLTMDGNINVGTDGFGSLGVTNGGDVRAKRVRIGIRRGSRGTVTVSGSGSTLATTGTENEVIVGHDGNGTLNVLDGGLVDTHYLVVARSGTGRAIIRGIAADGNRSRVIASPDHGRFRDLPDHAGSVLIARNDGSNGTVENIGGRLAAGT